MVDGTRADGKILEFFRSGSYNGQGREHINEFSEAFLSDLVAHSKEVETAASDGEIVYERNFASTSHRFSRDIDLAVGSPQSATGDDLNTQKQLPTEQTSILEGQVKDMWLSLNMESLISSVGGNWKNRGEDIYVYYLSSYDDYNLAVTGSIVLLNLRDWDRDVDELISTFEEFDLAGGSVAQSLDALAIIPLDYDETAPGETEVVSDAVPPEHPLNYGNFIDTMARSLAKRIEGDFEVSKESLGSVLAETETEVLEFKEELGDLRDIAKEAVAFANYDGGSILIGVDDSGSVSGLEDVNSAEERVLGILENIDPQVTRNIEKATYDGENLLIVNVSRSTAVPASFNGTFYIRKGTSKTRMTGRQLLERFPREK